MKRYGLILAAGASILLAALAATATADVPELCILTAEPHVGQPYVLTVYDDQPNKVGQVSFSTTRFLSVAAPSSTARRRSLGPRQPSAFRWISVVKYKDGVNVGGGARQIEVEPATCS
ncbi:hypothetical protein OG563_28620 [Nocardia vinacea]|uniref:Uncharacterized protein n=1 Tax=Nocardia vinacea TaxID=96468 RepID=A0ABZ1YJP6_9NOCA|nr:hypothetical protein [Nocardia vinacea]